MARLRGWGVYGLGPRRTIMFCRGWLGSQTGLHSCKSALYLAVVFGIEESGGA